jgi:hypothetical protein
MVVRAVEGSAVAVEDVKAGSVGAPEHEARIRQRSRSRLRVSVERGFVIMPSMYDDSLYT